MPLVPTFLLPLGPFREPTFAQDLRPRSATTQTVERASSAPAEPTSVRISGAVHYLSTVGFKGGGRGLAFKPRPDGSPCPTADEYSDIRSGAAVTISAGSGDTLATVPLGEASRKTITTHSRSERNARADLIDGIFNLRVARTWNQLEISRLNIAHAKQTVFDLKHPNRWDFEGAKFVAVWCELPFATEEIPESDTFVSRGC